MKTIPIHIILILILFSSCKLSRQERRVVGSTKYKSYHGSLDFIRKRDHTYNYKFGSTFCHGESLGIWRVERDTAFFTEKQYSGCRITFFENDSSNVFKISVYDLK